MTNETGEYKQIKWLSRIVPVSDLKPFEKNPRKITPADFDSLKRSLAEDGYHQRILCTPDLRVIGGHQRIKALKELGYSEIECLVDDQDLPDSQFKRILVRDNLAYGQWDFEALGELMPLDELGELGLDDSAIQKTAKANQDGLTDPDETPAIPELPVSSLGDVWLLGAHRLMCGSSTDADAVQKLLAGVRPMLMVTDPPYGVNLDQSWRDKALGAKAMGPGNKSVVANDDIADWTDAWKLFPGDVAYVWHAGKFSDVVMNSLRDSGFDISQQLIWNKSIMVMGRSDYHFKHEPCWYAVRKGKPHGWTGDRKQTTVIDAASPNHIMAGSKEEKTEHPTQKPVACFLIAGNHNGDMYDPFCGSGTSIITAEMLGRRGYGMELSPAYCDVIVERWQAFTGLEAIHAVTGATFNSLKQEQAA
jgi:DNA modification methylase